MIRTIEIPRSDWEPFFNRLNKSLEGRAVQVEGVNPVLGAQTIGDAVAFEGIAYESKGSDAGALTLHIGIDDNTLDHRVFRPTKVYIGMNELNELEWLSIEEEDRGKTLVHFQDLPKLEGEQAHPH
jgi:hypothetical protein